MLTFSVRLALYVIVHIYVYTHMACENIHICYFIYIEKSVHDMNKFKVLVCMHIHFIYINFTHLHTITEYEYLYLEYLYSVQYEKYKMYKRKAKSRDVSFYRMTRAKILDIVYCRHIGYSLYA